MFDQFSLNGAWEMSYNEAVYTGTDNPWEKGSIVENAIPGYWEDMTDAFAQTSFFRNLKINPEYGIQRYPICTDVPDMALPNVMGNFLYRRIFTYDGGTADTLHFGGVQNTVSAWINGVYLGRHAGYCTPFEMAIPAGVLKQGENEIVLSVSNLPMAGFDGFPIFGLTNRAVNLYTGGVFGDVSLRTYQCPVRDVAVCISEDCQWANVYVQMAEAAAFRWKVLDGDHLICEGEAAGDFALETALMQRWTPENPKCYTLQITCGEAVINQTFGVRRLTADGAHLKLNGDPVYLRGVCEHCYFPETVHPVSDITFYRNVIRTIKNLGFNFIRFHTFVPAEEYMLAADELGIMLEVESPNNTTVEQMEEIVRFCRKHPSVVMYSCGNEMPFTNSFIEHLNQCADVVHENCDSLFSPLSALGRLEYNFAPEQTPVLKKEPFEHDPVLFERVGKFADVYNTFTNCHNSYESLKVNPEEVDSWNDVYGKPRLSHEIGIHGTYTDLSLKKRYEGTRVGATDMFDSLERHLKDKGLYHKAPLYFKNSCQWQRLLRKHTFESVRKSQYLAGYDYLGPIDTHWHTFGYDVGMMNEFYEMKPGETVRNVRMYNSETVLLADLNTEVNFTFGEELRVGISVSHYGKALLQGAQLNVRLTMDEKLLYHYSGQVQDIAAGSVCKLHDMILKLPEAKKPGALKLYVTLDCGDVYAENEWQMYAFPKMDVAVGEDLIVSQDMSLEMLTDALEQGRNVLLLGAEPFVNMPTTFQIALAGRASGNLATVISDHPAIADMPHDGYCGWQFCRLLEEGRAVCFEDRRIPFDPIIEVVSTHKNAIPQAALFEFSALNGRALVCSFHFDDTDPAAVWLKNQLIRYAQSDNFAPKHDLTKAQLEILASGKTVNMSANSNVASNKNDKATERMN